MTVSPVSTHGAPDLSGLELRPVRPYGVWVPIVLLCYPGCLSHPFSLGLVALSSGPCGEVYPARKGSSLDRPRPLHCTDVARPQAQGPAESESQCRAASDDLAVGAMLRHNLTAKVPCLRTNLAAAGADLPSACKKASGVEGSTPRVNLAIRLTLF